MIIDERNIRKELIITAGKQMLTAARTAPKGKGVDIIEVALVTESDIELLSMEMRRIANKMKFQFFLRDADNLSFAGAVLLIGTKQKTHGLNCAYCGFKTCEEKPITVPCALNTIDLGIAVGSACSVAADLRVDTRVMFSAGLAAKNLQFLGDCENVIAIPISISSKNPFFDRKNPLKD